MVSAISSSEREPKIGNAETPSDTILLCQRTAETTNASHLPQLSFIASFFITDVRNDMCRHAVSHH